MADDALTVAKPVDGSAPVTESVSKNEQFGLGMALCLSGGGYRAMVFHVGAIQRLNEVGLLKSLKRISSVSGGSIIAGMLGLQWNKLQFDGQNRATNLKELVIDPIRKLAGITIDIESIIGALLPWETVNGNIIEHYEDNLFGKATLQDLPDDTQGPRFVINATSMQSGALWRFSKPYMADYLVGMVKNPTVRLSVAVAASSAFPPVLSPAVVKLNPADFEPDPSCPLQRPPYTEQAVLSDGGVYDNLGLETAWKRYKTILVSDGGGKMQPEEDPKRDWARHAFRVLDVIDNQVRSLRKRQLIEAFQNPASNHDGTYWGIRTEIQNYQLPDALPCDPKRTLELANTPTRLKALDPAFQERLMNWGYAVCDAAIRKHVDPKLPAPTGFPYPTPI